MRKVEKYIYLSIIIILIGIICTGLIYIIVKNKDNKTEIKYNNNSTNNNNEENNNSNIKEDGIKLLRTYNQNDNIVEEFEVTLNNKTNNFKITYTYEENDCLKKVKGKIGSTTIYEVEDEGIYENSCKTTYTKDELFNTTKIKDKINENNFKIIKGQDNRSYLAFYGYSNYIVEKNEEEKNYLHIFNDNLEVISKDIKDSYDYDGIENMNRDYFYEYHDATNINIVEKAEGLSWYGKKDNCSECNPSYKILKIEDNKIYYLALNIPQDWYSHAEAGDAGYGSKIEEREYTINNNKLEYKIIKEYKVEEISNMI